jgi:hypothetical protein
MSCKRSKNHFICLKERTSKIYGSKALQVVSAHPSFKGVLEPLEHEERNCFPEIGQLNF